MVPTAPTPNVAAGKPAQATPAPAPAAAAAATGPQVLRLKKGEYVFAEGENSRAMYLLKSGMIRIFKRKGDSCIEIDTIHSGQVLGELAFLDGNPRSASGEALTDCELMEISGPTFQAVLTRMPEWLKILLKTVVGRLRTSSTRIRQLETASTSYDYDKDGKRSAHYVYMSPHDILKVCSALLLVASRNGTQTPSGIEIRVGLLQRYGNQIMGIPVAKLTTLLDILTQIGVVTTTEGASGSKTFLNDIDFLEKLIAYLNEENLTEPSKRHDLSLRGFMIMSLIARHLHKFPKDPANNLTTVNLGEIKKSEMAGTGKEPFRMDEFPELVKLGYMSNVSIKSAEAIFTSVDADAFMHSYRLQRAIMAINAANEQKRKGGGK